MRSPLPQASSPNLPQEGSFSRLLLAFYYRSSARGGPFFRRCFSWSLSPRGIMCPRVMKLGRRVGAHEGSRSRRLCCGDQVRPQGLILIISWSILME